MHSSQAVVILVTSSSEEESERIARALLERNLIACANILPRVRSLFHWEGAIEDESESLLILKTTSEAVHMVEECVRAHHSYDVPEVIALPITGGSDAYLSWVGMEVLPNTPGSTRD